MPDLFSNQAIMRVIDFETTGFDPPEAQVIEVAWCDFDRANMLIGDGDSYLCGAPSIPPETRLEMGRCR